MDSTYDDLPFKHIKLVSGEEITGFVVSETAYDIVVDQPHIVRVDSVTGQIYIRSWFEMSDQTIFKISNRSIIQSAELEPQHKEEFMKLLTKNEEDEYIEDYYDDDSDFEMTPLPIVKDVIH